ncbi:MAG: FAD-dependent oxidoreductase [Dehalococcoidia bacterium]|nr:FAD-dependent oxidoreductase [Dehalococcoidia bacterium]
MDGAVTLAELSSGRPLDLVIVGGGINGCGVASMAARAGLRVALFEADDFGFGTTWRSTKLVHGGLRYLEHGDVRLVRESLQERSRLLRTRPYLVQPQRFILPLVPWSRRPAWQLRIGLAAYDALAFRGGLPRHARLSRRAAADAVPALTPQQQGAFAFYDGRALAPERLALEFALEAHDAGAFVLNHARVAGLLTSGGAVAGVAVEHAGGEVEVPCSTVLNAAGPWVDEVVEDVRDAPLLGLTRGTHILLDVPDMPRDAVFSTARSDGRVFFAVPQGELLLVGTTDDRYEGDPGAVHPLPGDIEYLLSEAAEVLPGLHPDRSQVRYAYAGLRPLQRVRGGPEAAITRRHELVDHGSRRGGPRGLYSAVGGKLTTYRAIAEELLDAAFEGRAPAPPAVPGLAAPLYVASLAPRTRMHVALYGPAATEVLTGGDRVVCEHTGAVEGEVAHAVRRELAVTLSDVLMRRTGIAWGSCRGLCCDERVAGLMAAELRWSPEQRDAELLAFRADVAWHLPSLDDIERFSVAERARGIDVADAPRG